MSWATFSDFNHLCQYIYSFEHLCQLRHLVVKFVTNASSATRWPKLEPMLITLQVGQSYKFDHQMAQFALVAKLSSRWRHLH